MKGINIFIANIFNFIRSIIQYFKFNLIQNSSAVEYSKKNFFEIPIIIINYNQLFYLKLLINSLLSRGYNNIIIIDNNSDYPPLLNYYKELDGTKIKLEQQNDNLGHMVFFKKKELLKKYAKKGYYILTDADIIPNKNLPKDFVLELIKIMENYHYNIAKVGFALEVKDIPEFYPLKKQVLKWEAQYWRNKIDKNIYRADIDTTFALYKPFYTRGLLQNNFFSGLRVAGDFCAKHGGWYLNPTDMSEEQNHYFNTLESSASWVFNKEGELRKQESNISY